MTKLTHLIGILKDKASQSKAALLSKRTTLSLLRATSHDSFTPPTFRHLSTLLSSGNGSRATASTAVEVLMDRLQGTNNAAVALKCLIAVHHIIHHGSFILQDQLSVYPNTGGRNYLNLSNFRHNTDPTMWELSSWVRWFAQHIEQLLCTSRILGFFLGNSNSRNNREERVSGLTNADLLTEFDSLVSLVEGICKRPNPACNNGNRLVDEIVSLARGDWDVIGIEVCVRVSEFRERLGGFKFGEAVELVCCLKRLEQCEEIVVMMEGSRESRLWDSAKELKEKVGMGVYREEGKLVNESRKLRVSESDRFAARVLSYNDFLRFPSGRLL
ncbi:putative clathrin assembly protein At4g40080 [Abrus precatorius]|uniref:Clathrin assembly protein At4g40080 n=1 Tax=Abrus precatorius TaxID=3816 RepID=A0A8B8MH43_ABRPR|nr:putative clathrin assembly protein At4g40080 [Abrus precatorius]